MKMINIIMATHNGEDYIEQQLNSIMKQTHKDYKLFIRDDNSTDRTCEIIESFILRNDLQDRFILEKATENLRYPYCFIEPLRNCPKSDYYAFSDQDDVWHEHKLEWAVKELDNLKAHMEKEPVLYEANMTFTDASLHPLHECDFARLAEKGYLGLSEYTFCGAFYGFTMVFNNAAREGLIKCHDDMGRGKDLLINMYCHALGKVVYDTTPCALYRRSNIATTIAENNTSNRRSKFIHYFKKFKNNDMEFTRVKIKTMQYMLDSYGDRINQDDRNAMQLFTSKGKRLRKAFWSGKFQPTVMRDIAFRFMFLSGRI